MCQSLGQNYYVVFRWYPNIHLHQVLTVSVFHFHFLFLHGFHFHCFQMLLKSLWFYKFLAFRRFPDTKGLSHWPAKPLKSWENWSCEPPALLHVYRRSTCVHNPLVATRCTSTITTKGKVCKWLPYVTELRLIQERSFGCRVTVSFSSAEDTRTD